MPDEAPETRPTWPYTSFKTLFNLFQRLEENKAVPPRIDRSFLGGSEGQKTQLLSALKFFELIGANGEVADTLTQLALHPKDRQRIVAELLTKHYPAATKLAAVNGTQRQLEETFTGLNGNTLRKAITFYLHAAKFANHSTSKFFKIPHGMGASKPRKQKGAAANGNGDGTPLRQDTPAVGQTPSSDLKTRYIELLMEKASANDTLDSDLLDRIERLLGNVPVDVDE